MTRPGGCKRTIGNWTYPLFALLAVMAVPQLALADKVGDVMTTSARDQFFRFLSLQDPSVRYGLAGSVLLGLTCGLLGAFIVVRRLALMGDALGHSVLPGICLGYLAAGSKAPLPMFIGAVIAGTLSAMFMGLVHRASRVKEDAAMGLTLSAFYALGICLLTAIQHGGSGDQSGLDKFLFGQAAAIGADDLVIMGVVTVLTVAVLALLYKELVVSSFDEAYARSLGLPADYLHYGLMALLSFAIVIAIQAVGVVLVSAMLVIPAATAYMLTDRMGWMLVLSSAFGILAGGLGTLLSFLGHSMPTGPFMVLSASCFFFTAFLVGPRYGIFVVRARRRFRRTNTERENTLKNAFHILEADHATGLDPSHLPETSVTLRRLADERGEPLAVAAHRVRQLVRGGLVRLEGPDAFRLTTKGWQRACEIVRNHRLWELYLVNLAELASDHVHEDAERIEHVLGEDLVRSLEERLAHPRQDPHGRLIPGLQDMQGTGGAS